MGGIKDIPINPVPLVPTPLSDYTSLPTYKIQIVADDSNTGVIYVGDADSQITELGAGDSITRKSAPGETYIYGSVLGGIAVATVNWN